MNNLTETFMICTEIIQHCAECQSWQVTRVLQLQYFGYNIQHAAGDS